MPRSCDDLARCKPSALPSRRPDGPKRAVVWPVKAGTTQIIRPFVPFGKADSPISIQRLPALALERLNQREYPLKKPKNWVFLPAHCACLNDAVSSWTRTIVPP